uniref:Putative ovule protein n=1 Tax=Solanum chacoense TaxID=4108 RepID=A0A0V0H106_SOLCH
MHLSRKRTVKDAVQNYGTAPQYPKLKYTSLTRHGIKRRSEDVSYFLFKGVCVWEHHFCLLLNL